YLGAQLNADGSGQRMPLPRDPETGLQLTSLGNINWFTSVRLTYPELRQQLLTFGQPNFFTGANLPVGNSLNAMSDFLISSTLAAAFGVANPNPNKPAPRVLGTGTSFT